MYTLKGVLWMHYLLYFHTLANWILYSKSINVQYEYDGVIFSLFQCQNTHIIICYACTVVSSLPNHTFTITLAHASEACCFHVFNKVVALVTVVIMLYEDIRPTLIPYPPLSIPPPSVSLSLPTYHPTPLRKDVQWHVQILCHSKELWVGVGVCIS